MSTITDDNKLSCMYIFLICALAEKLLLMLQSAKRGYAVDSTNPKVHECLVRLHRAGGFNHLFLCFQLVLKKLIKNISERYSSEIPFVLIYQLHA